ncbi:hypothetical protein HDF24_11485 [Mucilaginibacter sp. X4EP1]|uniref:hypothetical protein n=1 Tax=Mucilaginibacter sp. X4EP1 TaxID=2723092 RepID=UPI003B0021A8
MEKQTAQENDPLNEDAREADGLWVSDDPYEAMKIMGFIPLEPEPIEPEEGLELPEAVDRIIAFLNNEHTVEQIEYILEMEERSGIEFKDYEEAWEWEQDPHNLTEERQLQYIAELEERADCAFEDLDEAMEWARTHCEEYENDLMEEGTQLMHDMRDIREANHEHSHDRLAQFELAHNNTLPSGHEGVLKPLEEPQRERISLEQDLQEIAELEELLRQEEEMEQERDISDDDLER